VANFKNEKILPQLYWSARVLKIILAKRGFQQ